MKNLARERAETGLVGCDFAGQRHAHHGAAVKTARKGDHARASGMGAGDLDRVLHRFRTRRQEDGLVRPARRHQPVQPIGKAYIAFVGRDLKAGVAELLELCRNRRLDPRMQMTGVEDGDAGGEIDIAPAFDIPDFGVIGLLDKYRQHRGHATRHGGLAKLLQLGIGALKINRFGNSVRHVWLSQKTESATGRSRRARRNVPPIALFGANAV